jgi:MoxR-like ATPase
VYRSLADLRRQLGGKEIVASDRRYRQGVRLLQAHAYLKGHSRVEEENLFFLEHVLWREPAQKEQVRTEIHQLLRGYEDEVKALLYQTQELRDYAQRPWETSDLRNRAVVEAHTKIRNILGKIAGILEEARDVGRPLETVEAVKQEIEGIQQRMLETL